jgi:FOG: CheY-like receiver
VKTPIEILLIEANNAAARLITEIFHESKWNINISGLNAGKEAMDYLHKKDKYKYSKTPSLILLELNLPAKRGHEVLEDVKMDNKLKCIPIIILTNSGDDEDVYDSYKKHANAYIIKSANLNKFRENMLIFNEFWFNYVTLPKIKV